jgi:hypothetical protein
MNRFVAGALALTMAVTLLASAARCAWCDARTTSLSLPITRPGEAGPVLMAKDEKPAAPGAPEHAPLTLSAERVQVMLRSLTVPGWGQATAGHYTSARVFGLIELGIWTSFASFRVQEQLRRSNYERTANILAGIDLKGRDEEFRRIVGSYISSDEYNLLVVSRDAANLYYNDPVLYRQYIAEHSLSGADAWSWPDDGALLRYRAQRKDTQRARSRANTSLALAVVNRLVSTLDVARRHPSTPEASRTWDLETIPDEGDPTAFRVGIRKRF